MLHVVNLYNLFVFCYDDNDDDGNDEYEGNNDDDNENDGHDLRLLCHSMKGATATTNMSSVGIVERTTRLSARTTSKTTPTSASAAQPGAARRTTRSSGTASTTKTAVLTTNKKRVITKKKTKRVDDDEEEFSVDSSNSDTETEVNAGLKADNDGSSSTISSVLAGDSTFYERCNEGIKVVASASQQPLEAVNLNKEAYEARTGNYLRIKRSINHKFCVHECHKHGGVSFPNY